MTVVSKDEAERRKQVTVEMEGTANSSNGTPTKQEETSVGGDTPADSKEEANMFDDVNTDTAPTSKQLADGAKSAKLPGVTYGSQETLKNINYEKYTEEELTITADEKKRFVESMVSGVRYTQTYDIFGGLVHVKLRSRTADETQAMYGYIRHTLSQANRDLSNLEIDMQYLLLVVQVEEINGTRYEEMRAPYYFTETAEGIKEPGWIESLSVWKRKPEGLTNALINRIQLFEYKYWTMVGEASNQNFWNTDTSIAD